MGIKLLRLCWRATPWSAASRTPLSLGFSRQDTRVGAMPSPDLPDPGIEPKSPSLLLWQAGSLPLAPPGSPEGLNIFYLAQGFSASTPLTFGAR